MTPTRRRTILRMLSALGAGGWSCEQGGSATAGLASLLGWMLSCVFWTLVSFEVCRRLGGLVRISCTADSTLVATRAGSLVGSWLPQHHTPQHCQPSTTSSTVDDIVKLLSTSSKHCQSGVFVSYSHISVHFSCIKQGYSPLSL